MYPEAFTLLVYMIIFFWGPSATGFLLPAASHYGLDAPLLRSTLSSRRHATKKPDRVAEEPELVVFDAEGEMSWEEYKSKKPDEYKVR